MKDYNPKQQVRGYLYGMEQHLVENVERYLKET